MMRHSERVGCERVYDDVVQMWKGSGVGYTPTLIVGYGGIWGENYWYAHGNVFAHERLRRFVSPRALDARARRRPLASRGDWNHIDIARLCKQLLDAGVEIQLGAHGQREGLAAHWELWSFVQGGMSTHQALRAATLAGAHYLGLDQHGAVMAKLDWLGLFGDGRIGVTGRSPAATLQHLLEQKWKLGEDDKDLVVMWHRFRYTVEGMHQEIHASLAVTGQDRVHTAMARTVGLPIAMACKLVLNGHIQEHGVLLPLKAYIYEPILDELEKHGVVFEEAEVEV